MNRAQGKQGGKSSDSSPLSLLVHAADAQQQPPGGRGGGGSDRGSKSEQGYRHDLLKDKAPSALEEHQMLLQRKAAAEAAIQQQGGLLPSLEFYQQNALAAAAQQQQQQQQLASLALASDIRSALAAAHLRQQAAQYQNQDFFLARAAAAQGLSLGGGLGNAATIEKLQQDLEMQRLEEMERRQQLLAAANRAPMQAQRQQQMEMQEAQARQEQLDRQLQREGLLAAAQARSSMSNGEAQSNQQAAAAAATRRDSGKEEFQKTPGSVIVPCRARGMPMDHNFKTAYFVIPENVQHGEELICSYFACRNAGIKFRYCTHCRVPVAKRNFRKRHKHGNSSSANDLDDDSNSGEGEETSIASNNKANGIPSQVTAILSPPKKEVAPPPTRKEKAAAAKAEAAAAALATCSFIQPQAKKSSMEPPAPVKPSSSDSVMSREKERPKPVSDDSDSVSLPPANKPSANTADFAAVIAAAHAHAPTKTISEERKLRWAALLGMRPPTKDGAGMSSWLMEVLSISDLESPLKEPGEAGGAAAAAFLSPANMALNAFQHSAANGLSTKVNTTQDKDSSMDTAPTGGSSHKESSKSILIKKKRPISMLNREGSNNSNRDEEGSSRKDAAEASAAGYTGSFAEWRDRKKQKVLSKKGVAP